MMTKIMMMILYTRGELKHHHSPRLGSFPKGLRPKPTNKHLPLEWVEVGEEDVVVNSHNLFGDQTFSAWQQEEPQLVLVGLE